MSARDSSEAISSPLARTGNLAIGAAIVVGGLALLLAMRMGWIDILPGGGDIPATPTPEPPAPLPIVQLTPEKLAAADLHTSAVKTAPIQQTRPVPATITYDAARRVPVNSPVAGIVVKVLVEPGQQVAEHQPLAELSSPEVGLTRDEVERRRTDLDLARKQLAFSQQIAKNVEALLSQLAQKPKLSDLERTLEQRTLGEYREKVLAAYSKLLLAEATLSSTGELEGGTLSKRLVEERKSAREVASAQFAAACETSRFSAANDRDKLQAAAEQAERLLAVSGQALANLLGPLADRTPVTARN